MTLSLRPEGICVTLAKYLSILALACSPLLAVPRLRLSSTVVGPITIAQGGNATAQDLDAYSVADRDASSETESLRLTVSSTVPWVAAAASALRPCTRRAGLCVPIRLSFSTQQLQAGLYSGTVLVADPAAIDAPQRILVTVSVGSTIPDRINLYVPPNGATDEFHFVTNSNVAPTVTPANSWLTLLQDSAGTFNFVRPFIVRARHQPGQAEGAYNGTIAIRNSTFPADNKTANVTLQVTSQPIAAASKSAVRVRLAQNSTKLLERLRISNRGLGRLSISAAAATIQAGGNWLTATKLEGFDLVDLTFNAADAQPGVYKANVAVTHSGVNSPLNIPVELEVVAQAAPAIRLGGVLENAVFEEGDVISAGGIVAAFGEQFTYQDPVVASKLPLSNELGGASVFVNDRPAPAYYVSYNQVNFQVPYDVPAGTARVRIDRGTTRGNAVTVVVVPASPKLLRLQLRAAGINMPESRDFFGIAVHQDGSLSLPREFGIPNSRPSRTGEAITVYGLGFGQTNPPVVAGEAAPASPLPNLASSTKRVFFGALALITGTPQDALYVGLTPGFVGLYQVNVVVPEDSPKGDVPIRVQLDTTASEYALIAVE